MWQISCSAGLDCFTVWFQDGTVSLSCVQAESWRRRGLFAMLQKMEEEQDRLNRTPESPLWMGPEHTETGYSVWPEAFHKPGNKEKSVAAVELNCLMAVLMLTLKKLKPPGCIVRVYTGSSWVQSYSSTSRREPLHLLQVGTSLSITITAKMTCQMASEQSPPPNKGEWFYNGALSDLHASGLSVWQSNPPILYIFMSRPGEVNERRG